MGRMGRSIGIVVAASGVLMGGCGLAPMASSHGPVTGSIGPANQVIAAASTGISEIHSSTCPGLDVERQERLKRIAGLQLAMASELANPPATVFQAMKRVSDTPGEGTVAHGQIMEERAYLASVATAAARLGCPPLALPAGGKTL
jgi:hypothetical protein